MLASTLANSRRVYIGDEMLALLRFEPENHSVSVEQLATNFLATIGGKSTFVSISRRSL